jgi:hypothetical protein
MRDMPMKRAHRSTLGLAGALIASAALAAPAMAVDEPPLPGRLITSFPTRDFVSATGYTEGAPATVQVRRLNPATGALELVARSTPVLPKDDPGTPGFDGLVEVNHPGGGCWNTITPNIQPGDKVRVLQRQDDPTTPVNDPILIADDQTTTANVITGRPEITLPATGTATVRLKGTAQRLNGQGAPLAAQVPVAQLESRLITTGALFSTNGRRDLRVVPKYDVPGSTTNYNWTATITGVARADVTSGRIAASEARILWLGRDPAAGTESTIMENHVDAVGGPAAPCTAPLEGTQNDPQPVPVPPSADTVPPATVIGVPARGHLVGVFPARDFVSAEGYKPGVPLTFNVFRPDSAGIRTLVGSATVTPDANGLAEVNHPGAGCWVSQTPNVRAGDIVRVTQDGVAEETQVANVTTKAAVRAINATTGKPEVRVTGTAATAGTEDAPAGARIPLAQLEQRLIHPDRFAIDGRRDIRATNPPDPDKGGGTLSYFGGAGSFTWRAVYSGLSEADITKALDAESLVNWLGSQPAVGNELTTFEVADDVLNGPAAPCSAPAEAA